MNSIIEDNSGYIYSDFEFSKNVEFRNHLSYVKSLLFLPPKYLITGSCMGYSMISSRYGGGGSLFIFDIFTKSVIQNIEISPTHIVKNSNDSFLVSFSSQNRNCISIFSLDLNDDKFSKSYEFVRFTDSDYVYKILKLGGDDYLAAIVRKRNQNLIFLDMFESKVVKTLSVGSVDANASLINSKKDSGKFFVNSIKQNLDLHLGEKTYSVLLIDSNTVKKEKIFLIPEEVCAIESFLSKKKEEFLIVGGYFPKIYVFNNNAELVSVVQLLRNARSFEFINNRFLCVGEMDGQFEFFDINAERKYYKRIFQKKIQGYGELIFDVKLLEKSNKHFRIATASSDTYVKIFTITFFRERIDFDELERLEFLKSHFCDFKVEHYNGEFMIGKSFIFL